MTVRQAQKLYGFVGIPLTVLIALAVTSWHPHAGLIPVLVFAVAGVALLRCPRCRNLAGWTRFSGPLAPPLGAPVMPKSCTWCALDFETARLGEKHPPWDPEA